MKGQQDFNTANALHTSIDVTCILHRKTVLSVCSSHGLTFSLCSMGTDVDREGFAIYNIKYGSHKHQTLRLHHAHLRVVGYNLYHTRDAPIAPSPFVIVNLQESFSEMVHEILIQRKICVGKNWQRALNIISHRTCTSRRPPHLYFKTTANCIRLACHASMVESPPNTSTGIFSAKSF